MMIISFSRSFSRPDTVLLTFLLTYNGCEGSHIHEHMATLSASRGRSSRLVCVLVKLVDIRRLKHWAGMHLKSESKLREIIILEDDYLLPEEYLSKMDVWLKLSNLEQ